MLIVSYDICNDRLRGRFSKMLSKSGAIRLQFSVYEINNSKRIIETLILKIEQFSDKFDGGDSVIIFDVSSDKVIKYGNAIHRDIDVNYF